MGAKRIPVAVLGATGSVGQRFVQLLADHPWFELAALAASERRAGERYGDAVRWVLDAPLPAAAAATLLCEATPAIDVPLVFSALSADVAGPIEEAFARAGKLVVSNASSHRMRRDVPLLVPEVNADHLALLERQDYPQGGGIVTNPNCSTIGLALALAPLERRFGVRGLHVVTLQAISGAGLGLPGMDLVDNVVPFIGGEEEKLASETRKILGRLQGGEVRESEVVVSAQCNRVPVLDGHTECVSLRLARPATRDELLAAWREFRAEPQELALPSAPARPVVYLDDPAAPQPRKHRDLERGMATVVGRLQPCPLHDWRFVLLSHNTLRGAAGGALLAAELAVARGRVPR